MNGEREPTVIEIQTDVQSMEIRTEGGWPPGPSGDLARELDQLVTEMKTQIGHGDHDGWRTESGVAQIFCGCGDLLCDVSRNPQ